MSTSITNESTAEKVAAMLLGVEAIKLSIKQPFVWSSGWRSPIYCDNRITLSHPSVRDEIRDALTDVVKKYFPDAEAVSGVATAGIPQATLIANSLNLPLSYVRSRPKGHGMENLIEGRITKGQKTVVVEDLVSTGGSSLKVVQALRSAGVEVLGMVSVFTYGFEAAVEYFKDQDVRLVSLSDYNYLLKHANSQGLLSQQELVTLKSWRTDPESWRP